MNECNFGTHTTFNHNPSIQKININQILTIYPTTLELQSIKTQLQN